MARTTKSKEHSLVDIGRGAFSAIEEMVAPLLDDEADDDAREEAREAVLSDALEAEIIAKGPNMNELRATDYMLLLSTGGPAVRIVGELDSGEPCSARLEVQDWGTPWTEVPADEAVLMAYASCFYFGE